MDKSEANSHKSEAGEKYRDLRAAYENSMENIELGIFNEEVQAFYQSVKDTYPREAYGHCILWHLIIGSTPDETDTDFDLPNGEIEDFIRNKMPLIATR